MRNAPAALSAAILATGLMALDTRDVESARGVATRSVGDAEHGMVAAAQPLAVQAGIQVLREGGSAVDAAIAVNACLGLMEPTANGLGGDLFAIIWDPKLNKPVGLNGSGRAPFAISVAKVPPDSDGTIPLFSPYFWLVPGGCGGWLGLGQCYSKLA